MDFSSATRSMKYGANDINAAKYPVWAGGYVFKTQDGLSNADKTAGKFRLVFVQANGDQFVYKWDGVADYTYEGKCAHTGTHDLADLTSATPVVSDTLAIDADLLEAFAASTWETGKKATYEGRRTGGGVW